MSLIPLMLVYVLYVCYQWGSVQSDTLVGNFYSQVLAGIAASEEQHLATAAQYANSKEGLLQHLQHLGSPNTVYFGFLANPVIAIANFFNTKAINEAVLGNDFDNFKTLADAINHNINRTCPVFNIDCTKIDREFRTINGFCNNVENPRYGSAGIAQTRVSESEWLNTGLVKIELNKPGFLVAIENFGMNPRPILVLPGIEDQKLPITMLVQGGSSFEFGVLGQEQLEEINFSEAKGGYRVPGIINSVEATSTGNSDKSCDEGVDFEYEGSDLRLLPGQKCQGSTFAISFQPRRVKVLLSPGGLSTLTIFNDQGETDEVDSTESAKFTKSTESLFWFEIKGNRIRVGEGIECDDRTVIMEAVEQNINLPDGPYNVYAGLGSDGGDVSVSFPVRDFLTVQTSAGNGQTLKDFQSSLYADGKLRCIVEADLSKTSDSSIRVELLDETNNLKIVVEITGQDNVDSTIRVFDGSNVEIAILSLNTPITTTNGELPRIWISWLANRVYWGTGEIIGHDAFAEVLDFNTKVTGLTFTPSDVILNSSPTQRNTKWTFDIIERSTPRGYSLSGRELPSARDISIAVHRTPKSDTDTTSPELTMLAFQFGQFLDHDLVATPHETANGATIHCCVDGEPADPLDVFCFNIPVTSNTESRTCIDFVRSGAILSCIEQDRDLRDRQLMNDITSFFDGSNVYGSDPQKTEELREENGSGARLAFSELGGRKFTELPTTDESGEGACASEQDNLCFDAGDFRVNEQPGLTSMHSLWVSEHNRLVEGLINEAGYKEGTPDEKEYLFQKAKAILNAQYQVIIGNEYLPSFLDHGLLKKAGIFPDSGEYDISLDASANVEVGIAYRFGHTWMHDFFDGFVKENRLDASFFNPDAVHKLGYGTILTTMSKHGCTGTDRLLPETATETLFGDLDLAALNVQRGRDHGLAGYCVMRAAYGLPVPSSFNHAVELGLFDTETKNALEKVYDCVCDIDLFTAVVAERSLKDVTKDETTKSTSSLGPLGNHVIIESFKNIIRGDSYWYSYAGSGFNSDQIAALTKSTLSRVLCDNTDIKEIQPNAFIQEGVIVPGKADVNKLAKCSDTDTIPKLELKLFTRTTAKSTKSTKSTKAAKEPKSKAKAKKRNQELLAKKEAEELETLIEILEDLKKRDEE